MNASTWNARRATVSNSCMSQISCAILVQEGEYELHDGAHQPWRGVERLDLVYRVAVYPTTPVVGLKRGDTADVRDNKCCIDQAFCMLLSCGTNNLVSTKMQSLLWIPTHSQLLEHLHKYFENRKVVLKTGFCQVSMALE